MFMWFWLWQVEKAQLEQAITQMNQMRDETAKVEALKQGLTLVAKELTKKADAESLQMVESVICQLEQAKPQADLLSLPTQQQLCQPLMQAHATRTTQTKPAQPHKAYRESPHRPDRARRALKPTHQARHE